MQAVRVAPPPLRAAGSAEDDLRRPPKLSWHLPDAAELPARPAGTESSPRLRVLAAGVSVAFHLMAFGVLLIASAQALRAVPPAPESPSVNMVFAAARPAPSTAVQPPTEQPAPAQPPSESLPVAQPPVLQPPPELPPPRQPQQSPTPLTATPPLLPTAQPTPPPVPVPLPALAPAPKPAAEPPPPSTALASQEALPAVVPAPTLPAPKAERHRRARPARHHPAVAERAAPSAPAAPSRQSATTVAAAAAPIVPPSLPGGMAERCPPEYPRAALRDHIEGRVVMRVHVAADGRPLAVSVVTSSGSALLDRAARAAADSCHFVPATQGGRPVPFDYEVPYRFRIEN